MRKFIAKHHESGLKITFKYGLNGVLNTLEFEGDWASDKIEKVAANITSTTEAMIEKIKTQNLKHGWIFAELDDVSFATFYKEYPRKVGPKAAAEKAWDKLGATDQLEAILHIPDLVNLKADGTAFPYPATYLNKKYWK